MQDFIQLIRVKQWIKNSFILFPAFFANEFQDVELVFKLLGGVLAFSLAASSVYVMNDWFDAPLDRLHPEKKFRPIASGKIKTERVFGYVVLLLLSALILSVVIEPRFTMIILIYFGINLVYSAGIKNFPVLDIAIVSFGFILRIIAGGEIADVPISKWMITVTFFLSMFLAFAKRRSDYILFTTTGESTRKVIRFYNRYLINGGLIVTALCTTLFYVLYTLDDDTIGRIGGDLYFTAIFVLAGLGRYMFLTFKKNLSGKPTEVLYSDRILQAIILGWIGSFVWLIYV